MRDSGFLRLSGKSITNMLVRRIAPTWGYLRISFDIRGISSIILNVGVLHLDVTIPSEGQVMSKGSKIVPVRIPDELLDQIEAAIQSANFHTKGEIYTVSSWIRKQLEMKLHNLNRSKCWARDRRVQTDACSQMLEGDENACSVQ